MRRNAYNDACALGLVSHDVSAKSTPPLERMPKRSVRLGIRTIDAIPVNPDREHWVWDTEAKGFFLRIYPSGVKTFAVKYRVSGRQKIYTIGKYGSPWTVEKARERANELLYEASKGDDPQALKRKRREARTVSQLIDLYLEEGPKDKPNKRAATWACDRTHLKRHVEPLLGAHKADTVTQADVSAMQTDIAAGKTSKDVKTKKRGLARIRGGHRSGAMTVVVLQAMYNWAIKRGLVGANPCKGVERFKSIKRERFLTQEELKRLFTTLDDMVAEKDLAPELASAFRLLVFTGARKNEIAHLRWDEIDFERAAIVLSDLRSKTGRRRIPLSARAMQELRSLPRNGDHVFPARRGDGPTHSLQDAWETIRIAAELEGVRIHDLRHTFASLAAAQGESLYLIGKALGHTQSRTTERYAHLAAEPVRAVGERVAAFVSRAIQEQSDA